MLTLDRYLAINHRIATALPGRAVKAAYRVDPGEDDPACEDIGDLVLTLTDGELFITVDEGRRNIILFDDAARVAGLRRPRGQQRQRLDHLAGRARIDHRPRIAPGAQDAALRVADHRVPEVQAFQQRTAPDLGHRHRRNRLGHEPSSQTGELAPFALSSGLKVTLDWCSRQATGVCVKTDRQGPQPAPRVN